MTTENKLLGICLLIVFIYFLYLISPIASPFVFSALLAYLGDPLVDKLEKKLSRTLSVAIVFLIIFLLLVAIIVFVMPLIANQLDKLISQLPEISLWIKQKANILLLKLSPQGQLPDFDLVSVIETNKENFSDIAKRIIQWISGSSSAIVAFITNLLLIPVVTFYLLRDWDVLIAKIHLLTPRYIEPQVKQIAIESNNVLSAFLRGQFMVMNALGIIYALGLSLIGLNSAILIGFIAGWLSFVPYLGLVAGSVSAVLLAYFQFNDILHPLGVIGVFIFAQLIEGAVLTPKFVGKRIGLHPVTVIFSVLAGGQLAGFMGILLALPIVAVLNVLIIYAQSAYQKSRLYCEQTTKETEKV